MATKEKTEPQPESIVVLMEDKDSQFPWGFEVLHGDNVVVSAREQYGSQDEAEEAAKSQFPGLEIA